MFANNADSNRLQSVFIIVYSAAAAAAVAAAVEAEAVSAASCSNQAVNKQLENTLTDSWGRLTMQISIDSN